MDQIESEIEQLAEKLEKAGRTGEGSRGGKVVGHTKSGKPIYEKGHEPHPDFVNMLVKERKHQSDEEMESQAKNYEEQSIRASHPKSKADHMKAANAFREAVRQRKNPGDSVKEGNARSHVQALNTKAAEMLHSGKIDKKEHDEIVAENQKAYKERMKKSFDVIMDTVMAIGPEGLKKAIPSLTDSQKALLQEVLSKAKPVSMDDKMPEGGIKERQEKSEEVTAKRKSEEDEELVKKEAAQHKHQGDSSVLEGQVIKSEAKADEKEECMNEDTKKQLIERMKSKGLKKSECIEAAKAKGLEPVVKAIEEFWGDDTLEKGKKEMSPVDIKKQSEKEKNKKSEASPEEMKNPEMEKGAMKKEVMEQKESEEDEKDEEKKPKEDKKSLKKSVSWKPRNLLEVSIRRGQNCHYSVEEALLKSEQETQEKIKKGDYLGDGEPLRKSEGKAPVTANDIIEKGLDMSAGQLRRIESLQKAKPNGAFTVQSFTEEELIKSMGLSEEEAAKALGEDLKKKS